MIFTDVDFFRTQQTRYTIQRTLKKNDCGEYVLKDPVWNHK